MIHVTPAPKCSYSSVTDRTRRKLKAHLQFIGDSSVFGIDVQILSLTARNMKCLDWLWFYSLITVIACPSSIHGFMISTKALTVGEELFRETLLLQNGARIYQLQGLKAGIWYEVKISYPASIPSSFSLKLIRATSDLGINLGRKLLNTEKLIFKADEMFSLGDEGGMSVLVTVEPEGVVAIPGKQEREHAVFNIVCDELLLGIPHKAWHVAVLVLVCLVLAFMVPFFLPAILLPKNAIPVSPLLGRSIAKKT